MNTSQIARNIALTILLLLLQVLALNHITLLGYATPYLYLMILLKLPLSLHRNWVIAISFVVGLVVDLFCNTLGMHALACSTMALARYYTLRLIIKNDEELVMAMPSRSNLGHEQYLYYTVILSTLFCLTLSVVQYFTLQNSGKLLLMSLSSALLTTIIIIALERLFFSEQ